MEGDNDCMAELQTYLAGLRPGPIEDTDDVEILLSKCWDKFDTREGGMKGQKLLDRMEAVSWDPPILTFKIERHAGTINGSTRAALQHWAVDTENTTATLTKTTHRQVRPMGPRINVKPIVEEITASIINHQKDTRLRWEGQKRVRIGTTQIFPKGSAFSMTLEGRRKRFRAALKERLAREGWNEVGRDIYILTNSEGETE
jgi:hypothetical protein